MNQPIVDANGLAAETARDDDAARPITVGRSVPPWRRWLPRVASVATLITTVCCIGVPAAVSLATSVGATFLLEDKTLQPLLIVVVLITIGGSALTYWRHRNPVPLIVTVIAGAAIYSFNYVYYAVPGVWLGAVALIVAQVWDLMAVRACVRGPQRNVEVTRRGLR